MNYYEALRSSAKDVEITPGQTSYFSVSDKDLDPRLFRNGKLVPEVRDGVLVLLYNHLQLGYNEPSAWTTVWLAGSGVSYNWSASRQPADLDCLVGINYVQFRQSNQEYKGWSDREIASEITRGFKNELHPRTGNFMDAFELTYYANPESDITRLKPYSAYCVTTDSWTVPPEHLEAVNNPDWAKAVDIDVDMAKQVVDRYTAALTTIRTSSNPAVLRNAEVALRHAVSQGAALFDDIHEKRGAAFSESGEGYNDFNNYRWQAGKQTGIVQAMRKLKEAHTNAESIFATETYGVELPDVDTLIRRASTSRY